MIAPGTEVRVKLDWPELRGPCHIRTPHYLRGAKGVVERHLGRFANPEELAFMRPAAILNLYHVRFAVADLWPDGHAHDSVVVELFEPWLETA